MTRAGVVDVSEFAEMGVELVRSTIFFKERKYCRFKCQTQEQRKEIVEVGGSHSSDETG